MPVDLSPAQTTLLLKQVGRSDDTELQGLIPDIAGQYPLQAARSSRLLFLYVKRDVLDILLGEYWEKYATQYGDEKESQEQQFEHLQEMRKDVVSDIATLESQLSGAGGFAAGQITQQTPIPGDPCRPDPNDRSYRGDPLRVNTNGSLWGGWR